MIDEPNSSPFRGFVRPALLLAGCVLAVALLLLPVAWGRSGSGGPIGLATAAAVCLAAGGTAEALAYSLRRSVTPLGVMLLGMGIRMSPPLGICLVLAARRVNGREHLAFIAYLLTFYLVTLALETWNAVKRIPRNPSRLNHNGAH
jgi:hypothetical protein